MNWDKDVVARMIELRGDGHAAARIATFLREEFRQPCTRDAVIGKFHRMFGGMGGAPRSAPKPAPQVVPKVVPMRIESEAAKDRMCSRPGCRLPRQPNRHRLCAEHNRQRIWILAEKAENAA